MEMKGQDERRFTVNLTHRERYRFVSQASEDGRQHGEPYVSDEPDPVGDAAGPATPALLASAIGHCLSAALLEALRKARVEVTDFTTEACAVVKPNADGHPRIDRVDVDIRPAVGETGSRTDRCAELFEKHCTVCSSVKKGITVNVNIDWQLPAG